MYPQWDFWFENKPSGNTDQEPILRLLNSQRPTMKSL
jgi:hypothetical protein